MTDQPMSDERLAEIEAESEGVIFTKPLIDELISEVRRLRGKDQDLDVLRMAYDEKVRLLENVAPQLLSDPDLWDTMRSERDEALVSAEESELALSSELRYTEELEAKLEKLSAYAAGLCDYKDAWADQERRAEKAKAEVERLRIDKDSAYSERNKLVAALSKVFYASLELDPDVDPESVWRWVVIVQLPTGQVSWHIHDSELPLFGHLPRETGNVWDGHSTELKYERLGDLSTTDAGERDDRDLWSMLKRERDAALARAEKARAEVERLRHAINGGTALRTTIELLEHVADVLDGKLRNEVSPQPRHVRERAAILRRAMEARSDD